MKAISLHQPWATLIAIGAKQIETRSWATKHRGEIAIHAAKQFGVNLRMVCARHPFNIFAHSFIAGRSDEPQLPLGAIVAVANLVEVIRTEDAVDMLAVTEKHPKYYPQYEHAFGNYAPGRFAWLLENVVALKTPVATRGYQSIWTLPDEIRAEIRAHLDSGTGVPPVSTAGILPVIIPSR